MSSDLKQLTIPVIGVGIGIWLVRSYFRGYRYTGGDRMDGRVVVITGGHTGPGKVTATELVSRGAHVIIACKHIDQGKATKTEILSKLDGVDGSNIAVMELDLASFASIRNFSNRVSSSYRKIDVLINNAAVYSLEREETRDGLEMTMGVNHFGHFLLTSLLIHKLTASAQGRIIFITSKLHCQCSHIDYDNVIYEKSKYSGYSAFVQSKLANLLFTRDLVKLLQHTKVTVNCCNTCVYGVDWSYGGSFLKSVLLLPWSCLFQETDFDSAQTTIRLAIDPTLADVSGRYFRDGRPSQPSKAALDEDAARYLVAFSEVVTNTKIPKLVTDDFGDSSFTQI